jgi:thiopurine S-methyltransferase
VKAVYDRASLIALDEGLRQKYVKHLNDIIVRGVRILLLTLNYPQHQRSGPPFAVSRLRSMNYLEVLFNVES